MIAVRLSHLRPFPWAVSVGQLMHGKTGATVFALQAAVRSATPTVLQQYLAALSRGHGAATLPGERAAATPAAAGGTDARLQAVMNAAFERLAELTAPADAGRDGEWDAGDVAGGSRRVASHLGELGWSLHVAMGVCTAQLRLCSRDGPEVGCAVPQIARMLLMRAARSRLGEADLLLCAQAVRLSERADAAVARGAAPSAAWRREVRRLGLAAAEALAAAEVVPLHAYADVASAATPGGPADTPALRAWATGAAPVAALRAATPVAAGEARAVAKLLRAAAAGAAAPAELCALRAATGEYTAVVAATAPVAALATLASTLHHNGGRAGPDQPEVSTACAALERELVLRYAALLRMPSLSVAVLGAPADALLPPLPAQPSAAGVDAAMCSIRCCMPARCTAPLATEAAKPTEGWPCRPPNDLKSSQAASQILYSLVCMDHAPSRGVAATVADALHPHFSAIAPVSAIRALWAIGRCGHAAPPLLLHLQAELRRLTTVISGPHHTQADRRTAAVYATGAPWALASAAADLPQGLAASCATLAANLAAAEPSILATSPVTHLSSFLWGLSTVRPAVPRRVTQRLFAALAAKVLPDTAAAAAPARPQAHDALFPHSTRVSFTQRAAGAGGGADDGDGEGRVVDPVLRPALSPLACVNVLVAAARFKFYNGALLQHTVRQLEELGGRALASLSLSRLTDLADALGSLRMYSECAPALLSRRLTSRCRFGSLTKCVTHLPSVTTSQLPQVPGGDQTCPLRRSGRGCVLSPGGPSHGRACPSTPVGRMIQSSAQAQQPPSVHAGRSSQRSQHGSPRPCHRPHLLPRLARAPLRRPVAIPGARHRMPMPSRRGSSCSRACATTTRRCSTR